MSIGLVSPGVFAAASGQSPGSALQILRITPSGEDVPAGQQIVFQFDRPVVALGRMVRDSAEIPITIEPALECRWRWLNPSTLSCRLDARKAMVPATRYRITVQPGISAEDGSTIEEEITHTFLTERPKVEASWFKTWLSPGTPRIAIRFNQPVQRESVAKRMLFEVEGGLSVHALVTEDPDFTGMSEDERGVLWLVSPEEDLPEDKAVNLNISPGVLSQRGPEPGIEDRAVVSFHTFPEFRFVGVECRDMAGQAFRIENSAPTVSQKKCNPSQAISLLFSTPTLKEEVQKGFRITPEVRGTRPDYDPWEEVYSDSRLFEAHQKGTTYSVSLPQSAIKPFSQYHLHADAGALQDEFGRPLEGDADMHFSTDHRPPDFSLYKNMPVLEKGLDTDAPLLVTNLREVKLSYQSYPPAGKLKPKVKTIKVPAAQDTPFLIPLKIRELISKPSGIAYGDIAGEPAVSGKEKWERWFFAQVTPFAVHVKLGHYNSLVWVTDLRSGQPVPGVQVKLSRTTFAGFAERAPVLSRGITGADGTAPLDGTETIDPKLESLFSYEWDKPKLFVQCEKGEDIAVIPLTYDFEVASQGANSEYIPYWRKEKHGHLRSWGATAQGIYKVGDTIQFKIYVRNQDNQRFVLPPDSVYTLKVIDPADTVVYEKQDIKLSSFGAFDGEFTVPKNGSVGWYRFSVSTPLTEELLEPLRVLVSDFTPAPFKVTTEINGKIFGKGDKIKATTQASLHAGGPYTKAATRVSVVLEPSPLIPQDPKASGFEFDIIRRSEDENTEPPAPQTVYQSEHRLDDSGILVTEFEMSETPILHGRLTVESAVRDERGKFVAGRTSADYAGLDRYVGLAQSDWLLQEGQPAKARVIVVDRDGMIASGVGIHIQTERRVTKASRVKGPGRGYLTQYAHEWVKEESFELASSLDPIEFQFTPRHAGLYRITATIGKDAENEEAQGGTHSTSIERWATGQGRVLWETLPGNVINLYPEKQEYRVGETARFMVQNPFPGAKALISVERFGVIKSWVQTLQASAEVIEVPVAPDYLPGFYLSVTVMSPRVEKPVGEDGEDLGKPTFGTGYIQVPVRDSFKEIEVQVKPEKEVYKPRDTVTVQLEARPRNMSPGEKAPPIELAVAVLDESVFDLLAGRKAYDPYQGFYSLDSLDLQNYNLLMHLVGRQKFEKKGANPGGGGGPDLGMRSVFKFVSYWNPSIPVDAEGKAKIQFQVPDNLTGWRVLAMAVTPEDRMGLGDKVFRVNQPTEIRPILPNQLTEGDRFEAGFSIMNRTDETRTLFVNIRADGPIETGAESSGGPRKRTGITQQVVTAPYDRTVIRLPLTAISPGEITLTASAGDERDQDSVRYTLKVHKRENPEVVASHGSTTYNLVNERVKFPADMREDTGKLSITAAPSILGSLDGAFEYLRKYPYNCWEQKLTRGVAAAAYRSLGQYLADPAVWKESEGLPGETLAASAEYQAPNGGMCYFVPRNEYADPYLSAYTALAFNWMRRNGHTPPVEVEERLSGYLNNLLRHNITPETYSRGMVTTVRAVALAALAEMGKLAPHEAERFSNSLQEMSLFGKAYYLKALLQSPETSELQRDTLNSILSHADEASGTLSFRENLDSEYQGILASPLRDNCAILSALLAYISTNPDSESTVKDIPYRLVRTILEGRKDRNAWPSTQENVFALMALCDFSRAFEKDDMDMYVKVSMDSRPLGKAHFKKSADRPAEWTHAIWPQEIGKESTIGIERTGTGRLYYSLVLSYDPTGPDLREILSREGSTGEGKAADDSPREQVPGENAGIEVHREYSVERDGSWVLLQSPMEIRTGELVRVDLYVSVPVERHFVVLQDPVPGGLEPVNRDIATSSLVDASKETAEYPAGSYLFQLEEWNDFGASRWNFYHRELRFDAARFYSDLLPPGHYHLSYVAQAVIPGEFLIMPAHAEEMYNPDVFGKGSPALLRVQKGE